MLDIKQAEEHAFYLEAAPYVIRNKALHASQSKLKGSKMPKLDAWLDVQDLKLSPKRLWKLLPVGEANLENSDVYRNESDDQVIESNEAGKKHPITEHGFEHRIRAAKNRR